jgi:hypothetical protein
MWSFPVCLPFSQLYIVICWYIRLYQNADILEFALGKFMLCAVIEHIGTHQSGHYIAYVRRDLRWFECNDDRIKEVAFKDVQGRQAAHLFYRLDPRPTGSMILEFVSGKFRH